MFIVLGEHIKRRGDADHIERFFSLMNTSRLKETL